MRNPIVSRLEPDDLAGVWAIEQTLAGPWTFAQLQEELSTGHGWQLVIRQQRPGPVLGYIFGTVILDEAEIRKIAIDAACRRLGLGHTLLAAACRTLYQRDIRHCYLEVRASNLPALQLYRKNNFQIIGQRKNYYALPNEDAILLKKSFNLDEEIKI